MSQFLGTHLNRLDAKGRVSIPASFRSALRAGGTGDNPTIVLRPSHKQPCIEAWPMAAFQELANPLHQLDVLSQAYEDLAAAIYGDAFEMDADKEGRIILPNLLVEHAGLKDAVAFFGMGRIFHIWEPTALAQWRAAARERTRQRDSISGHAA